MSIDSQLREMRTLAVRDGLDIAVEKTESHSAKMSRQRVVFDKMVKDARDGKYNAILTWAPDRLSRNAGDLGQLVDLMDQGHLLQIRTYNQTFTDSPNDKFLLMILCSQAKLENDNRGVNVSRGMRACVGQGRWPGLAPLGYLNSRMKGREGLVEIDPERAPIVRQIFEKMADQGRSGREIYHWLNEIGFKTRSGKPLAYASIFRILESPFYYGRFEWPRGGGIWHEGKHEPLIDQETYERARRRLTEHIKVKNTPKEPIKSYPLARLMHCGRCGSGISVLEKFKQSGSGKITIYVYYGCTRGKDRWCKNLYINEQDLLKQLGDIFDEIDIDLIGMKKELEDEIERLWKTHHGMRGVAAPVRPPEQREIHLRKWAKSLLREGTAEEKRGILAHLKSKLMVKDKRVYISL